MTRPQLDREAIRDRGLAQPQVENGELVTEAAALAFFEDLKQNNHVLYDHIRGVINAVESSLTVTLAGEVSPKVLRGIVARAAIAGAAQIISDTGQSYLNIEIFKENLGITTDIIPTAEL